MLARRRSEKGFTLIELLVVVAIIGILAAIAIVNFLNAVARAKQKRTMADMRTIALAWEERASEARTYTTAGFSFPASATYDQLTSALVPAYTKHLPRNDGWGNPLEFGAVDNVYAIRSPGRDGVFEGTSYAAGETDNPDCDIVYSNGNFVRYPANVQGN
jgi:general secretion pathway protein G